MKDNSNITQELLETIERYYNDSMSTDERIEFESKLHQDTTFKSQVEEIKALLIGLESQSLKEKLDEFHKEMTIQKETEPSPFKFLFFPFKYLTTAIIIIIALGGFWFFQRFFM